MDRDLHVAFCLHVTRDKLTIDIVTLYIHVGTRDSKSKLLSE